MTLFLGVLDVVQTEDLKCFFFPIHIYLDLIYGEIICSYYHSQI